MSGKVSYVRENYAIFGKTLIWINSGKSNLTLPLRQSPRNGPDSKTFCNVYHESWCHYTEENFIVTCNAISDTNHSHKQNDVRY
jgi:hypothetical protein